MSDVLTSATLAVRAAGSSECGELATATRARLRRSLEVRARSRHRLVRVTAVMAVLFVSTVSWALSTGRLSIFVPRDDLEIEAPHTEASPVPTPQLPRRPLAAIPETAWPTPPQEAPAPPAAVAPRKAAPRPAPTEILYRKAHELHFHGGDHAAALAAWDAYLAAEPTGRFAVEARYNRALVLVRLGRYHEAREALGPFARGEVTPADYRRHEAAEIVDRLAPLDQTKPSEPLNDPTTSGD